MDILYIIIYVFIYIYIFLYEKFVYQVYATVNTFWNSLSRARALMDLNLITFQLFVIYFTWSLYTMDW